MTSTPTRPLNSFETELLADLREHVAGRAPAPAGPVPGRWRRRTVRLGVGAAVIGTAAAVSIGYAVHRPEPAYALSVGVDGRIRVSVHSLSDEAGLEAALAEHGVTSDITYLPRGMVCAQPRATLHRVKGGHAFTLDSSKGSYHVTLSPVLADPSLTVVIEASVLSMSGTDVLAVGVQVARSGSVTPCRPVSYADLIRGRGPIPTPDPDPRVTAVGGRWSRNATRAPAAT